MMEMLYNIPFVEELKSYVANAMHEEKVKDKAQQFNLPYSPILWYPVGQPLASHIWLLSLKMIKLEMVSGEELNF